MKSRKTFTTIQKVSLLPRQAAGPTRDPAKRRCRGMLDRKLRISVSIITNSTYVRSRLNWHSFLIFELEHSFGFRYTTKVFLNQLSPITKDSRFPGSNHFNRSCRSCWHESANEVVFKLTKKCPESSSQCVLHVFQSVIRSVNIHSSRRYANWGSLVLPTIGQEHAVKSLAEFPLAFQLKLWASRRSEQLFFVLKYGCPTDFDT